MTKTFQAVIQYLRGSTRLEFLILVIRICFGFRVSCFEFIENPISKQFSLSQQVISLNDVALNCPLEPWNRVYNNIIIHTKSYPEMTRAAKTAARHYKNQFIL